MRIEKGKAWHCLNALELISESNCALTNSKQYSSTSANIRSTRWAAAADLSRGRITCSFSQPSKTSTKFSSSTDWRRASRQCLCQRSDKCKKMRPETINRNEQYLIVLKCDSKPFQMRVKLAACHRKASSNNSRRAFVRKRQVN